MPPLEKVQQPAVDRTSYVRSSTRSYRAKAKEVDAQGEYTEEAVEAKGKIDAARSRKKEREREKLQADQNDPTIWEWQFCRHPDG